MTKTKQMLKGLCAMSLAVGIGATALTALPTDADATVFGGSFTVNANSTDPGLRIYTEALNGGLFTTMDLAEGESDYIDLFRIWTNETSVNWLPWDNDDTIEKLISVEFTFTPPPPEFGGPVTGTTDGHFFLGVHWGSVTWEDPVTLSYPGGGYGELEIKLFNADFNRGLFGLCPGECSGATIKAKFTNIKDPTPAPEPATLAVLGLGLASLGWAARRRKQTV